jgi:two-component system CheB/CheR fusion protein
MPEKKQTKKKTARKKKTPSPEKTRVKKKTLKTRKKTAAQARAKKNPVIEDKKAGFSIVGIGASAGGLEAFGEFFNHMPENSGMAFVLVPHLDPTHKSIIGEILTKYTRMPISQVKNGMKVEPNSIYIIQPDKDLAILQGKLHLMEPAERRGLRHPIDFFFRSLAQDQGDNAISIILSGTGTEGTLGLKEIKGEGGLVIVQDPRTAKYDGMPQSAINTDLVDYVLPPEKMPDQLMRYVRRSFRRGMKRPESPKASPPDSLQKIFILIRNQTGHDFSLYKLNTITRRIERRMNLHQIDNIADYVKYLRGNPPEVNMLFKELLIRVTNFFRDPKAFEILQKKVLPDLFKQSTYEWPLRVWVPACSTGEEAYSIAIAFYEYIRDTKTDIKVQIFATDIDNEAIEVARSGIYPESISVDVSPERLKKFFSKEDSSYRVIKKIREMVVFASQNLIKDPPFSKINLISCRNLLIYLGPHLQKKLIPIFHYALKSDGILFLGTSESIGAFSALFSVYNNKWKMFKPKRVPPVHLAHLDFPDAPKHDVREPAQTPAVAVKPEEMSLGNLTEKLLLDSFAPSCVIVNESGDILYVHGRTGKYLEPSPGTARMNLYDMAREGLKLELRAGVRKVIAQKKDFVYEGLKVRANGDINCVNLTIKYVREHQNLKGLIMVIFADAAPPLKKKTGKKMSLAEEKSGNRIAALEFELKSTREQLQTSVEELEASNEELQSTNEELQSANEELQSTNEELVTSKEELQSVNEELMTLNAESESKIEELTQLSNDINNLLTGTEVATIFLDTELRIKRYTPSASKVINLIPSDLGRPISDISSTLEYKDLLTDVEDVLRTLIPKEIEVSEKSGLWFLMRIMPYRTYENVINGVVITLIDITAQKRAQIEMCDTLVFSDNILETVRESLLVLDSDLRVISANESFYKSFKVTKQETEGTLIYKLGNNQWDIPKLRKLLERILPKNTQFNDFEVEHDFLGIGRREMLLNARRIMQKGKGTEMILLAIEDVTSHK